MSLGISKWRLNNLTGWFELIFLSAIRRSDTRSLPKLSRSFNILYTVIIFEVIAIVGNGLYILRGDLADAANERAKPVVISLKSPAAGSVEALNSESSDDIVNSLMKLGFFSYAAIIDDFGRVQSEVFGDTRVSAESALVARVLGVDLTPVFSVELDTTSSRHGLLIAKVNLSSLVSARIREIIVLTFGLSTGSAAVFFIMTRLATMRIKNGVEALIECTDHSLSFPHDPKPLKHRFLEFQEFQLVASRSRTAADRLRSSLNLIGQYQAKHDDLIEILDAALAESRLVAAIFDARGRILFQSGGTFSENWMRELLMAGIASERSLHEKMLGMGEITAIDLGIVEQPRIGGRATKQYQIERSGAAWILIWTRLESGSTFLMLQEITKAHQAARNAMHAEKMEALGRIASGVAHEFNNMLAIVIGNLDLVRPLAGNDRDVLQHIDTALQAAQRAGTVVSQLKTVSKSNNEKVGSVELSAWRRNIEPMLKVVVGPQIKIEYDFEQDLTIEVNEAYLDTAVINLCKNARDAIDGAGTVTLSARTASAEQLVNSGVCPTVPYAAITVSDTGPGFKTIDIDKVVEPFFSTKPPGLGTGLGLSSVYAFAKSDQGGFHIGNGATGGAELTILKRIASSRIAVSQRTEHMPRPGKCLNGSQILILEDEQSMADVYQKALANRGARVTTAQTIAACRAAIDSMKRVDMAILDLSVPDGSGTELVADLTRQFPKAPIIFISGDFSSFENPDPELISTIEKPFRISSLIEKSEQLLQARAGSL